METRSASKRKATFEATGALARSRSLELEEKDAEAPKKCKVSNRTKNKIISVEPQEPTNFLDMLPHVALRVLYKYLPVEDTLNTYSLSPRMTEVASEKSTWKDKVLHISDVHKLREYRWIIRHCPLLRGVCFSFDLPNNNDYFFHCLLYEIYNMKELYYLNTGAVAYTDFCSIIRKFTNLEKVEVCVPFRQLPILLELKYCTKLRELNLNFDTSREYEFPIGPAREQWRIFVTKKLTNSFLSLTSLDLAVLQRSLEAIDVFHILESRKDQLLNLKLILNNTALLPVIDKISSWTRLNLDLTVTKHLTFNADRLKLLKSLKLTMTITKEKVHELNNIFSGIPLPNVKVLRIFLLFNPRDVTEECFLRKLISKFPKLQALDLVGSSCKDIDEQLSEICNLTELESLRLRNLRFLTCHGLSHLTQCKSLKELHLLNIRLNKLAVESISKCIKLERLTIKGKFSKKVRHSIKILCYERNITLNLKV